MKNINEIHNKTDLVLVNNGLLFDNKWQEVMGFREEKELSESQEDKILALGYKKKEVFGFTSASIVDARSPYSKEMRVYAFIFNPLKKTKLCVGIVVQDRETNEVYGIHLNNKIFDNQVLNLGDNFDFEWVFGMWVKRLNLEVDLDAECKRPSGYFGEGSIGSSIFLEPIGGISYYMETRVLHPLEMCVSLYDETSMLKTGVELFTAFECVRE